MQAIIGGAYNGKRQYVRECLKDVHDEHVFFFEGEIPEAEFTKDDYVVIGNFEKILEPLFNLEEVEMVEVVMEKIEKLDETTNLICICTDIGRGIVPLSTEDRKLRDGCGRLYQKVLSKSETVVRVWYGIPDVLKGDGVSGER